MSAGIDEEQSEGTMNRRHLLTGASFGIASLLAQRVTVRAIEATPETAAEGDMPTLRLTLTDDGFAFDQPLVAGRYEVTVTNAGTLSESHFALGKIPDRITDVQYEAFLAAQDSTKDLRFEEIGFVGVPDWPAPGSSVSGVIELEPGRYMLFDPFSGRETLTLSVEGKAPAVAEPAADLTVELREMAFDLPETAITRDPMRWKIANAGAISHELAVLPVATELNEETFPHLLEVMMSLPEGATPPPDLPEFVYQPVAAIGILAPQHTSWLDVQLAPGRYLAICMLPFGTGYPHAMDGMYRFFTVP
jgi:hypothetical protein